MANELRISTRFQFLRSGAVARPGQFVETVITTTQELSEPLQVVGTSHELLSAGDVSDDAFLIVENLHATAIVQIGGDDTGAFVPWFDLPPGYPPLVVPRVAVLADTYLKSDTASTPVRLTLCKIVVPS